MRFALVAILFLICALQPALAQAPAPGSTSAPADTSTPAPDAASQPAPGSTSGTAPSDQTAPTQSPPATPPAILSAPATPPPPVHIPQGLVRIGWENDNVTGNQQTFLRDATPPNGFYLDELRYTPYSKIGDTGVIDLESPFEPDYRGYTQLALFNGYTQVEALLAKSRYFALGPFYGLDAPSPSDRAIQELYVRQRIANWLSVSSRYNMIQQDDNFDTPDPLADLHQRTRYEDLALVGLAGGGYINLAFSDWHYFDRTQILPNTDVKRWEGSYQHNLGAEVVTAKVDWLTVATAGQSDGHVTISSLTDDLDLGSTTSGQITVRQDQIDLPIVQNAYVREQASATASISDAFNTDWSAAFAFQNRSAQRVNDTSTAVNDLRWQTEELRIDGNLGRGWRVLGTGWATNLYNAPQIVLTDPESPLWTNTQYANVRLDGVADTLQGYFDWSYNRNGNTATSTVVQEDIYNVGGDWQAAPALDLYADYTDDLWNANDNQAIQPTLDQFVPGSRVFSVGANWAVTRRANFSAGYSEFETSNANPLLLPDESTSGRFLTLQFQQTMAHGEAFGITLAPWAYRDQTVDSMDYNAAVVKVTLSTPF